MSSTSETLKDGQLRRYERATSVVFLKTNEEFGGLSNMAAGFPLKVNSLRIFTAEALYQACRFPHRPEVQRVIIGQASPMTAKMKSKPYRHSSRPDWDRVRVKIMRWCLRVKLAQNWASFSELLLKTADRPIVEQSRKDDFWGAKETEEGVLVGRNVLGRLLMELREAVKTQSKHALLRVEPLVIPDFLLDGRIIGMVQPEVAEHRGRTLLPADLEAPVTAVSVEATQPSLFDQPAVKQAPAPYVALGRAPTSALSDLRPYPAMKDSSVPWLEEVPAHWEVLPALAVYKPKLVKNTGMREKTVLSLSYGRIIVKPSEKLRGLVPESFETYQIVEPGDIIVRTTDLQNDKTSLRIGHSKHRGIITAAYMCLETTARVTNEFGYQLLNAYDLVKIIYGFGSGLRQNLDFSHIKRMPVLVPPKEEQAAIVRFLDWADGRIRRVIRARQRRIKLLEEYKQALIHRAVTGQIDVRTGQPYPTYKPSGVEWPGEVPEHWEVTKLSRVVTSSNAGEVIDKGWWGRGDELLYTCARNPLRSDYPAFPNAKRTTGADLLLTRNGTPYVHRPPANAIYSNVVQRIKLANGHNGEWIARTLEASTRGMKGYGVSIESLNYDMWKALVVLLPRHDEQSAIVRFLDEQTEKIDAAIAADRREIELLKEFRTRLIADVVTGKLDVREVASSLPGESEADEPEPLDEEEPAEVAEGLGEEDLEAVAEKAVR